LSKALALLKIYHGGTTMRVLFVLAWLLFGILGGIFCAAMVGGPMLLADLRPRSVKAALGASIIGFLGMLGGALAGIVIFAMDTQMQGGESVSGAIAGGCIGGFLLPFVMYHLYPLLVSRLAQSTKDSGFAYTLIRPLGCVIAVLACIAGAYLGAALGALVGAGSFLLGGALGPFTGGMALLVIPLQLWVTLHDDTYGWSPKRRRGTLIAARTAIHMRELQRQSRSRSRRWD
jgi:hypothetical protein